MYSVLADDSVLMHIIGLVAQYMNKITDIVSGMGYKITIFKFSFEFVQVQSTQGPPIPPHSGLAKKTAVLENGVKGRNIIYLLIL